MDLVELQEWAHNELSRVGDEYSEARELPDSLSSSTFGAPNQASIHPRENGVEAHVIFEWGGGFGHRGLVIGYRTFVPPDDGFAYYLKWAAGVYVYHEIQ